MKQVKIFMAVVCFASSGFLLAYDEQANKNLMSLLEKLSQEKNSDKYNAFFEAAWNLANKKSENPDPNLAFKNSGEHEGWTLMHFAAASDKDEPIGLALLLEGINVSPKSAKGDTPLHIAAYNGDKEIINALLQAGADFAITNNEGKTAAQVAKESVRDWFKERENVIAVFTKLAKNPKSKEVMSDMLKALEGVNPNVKVPKGVSVDDEFEEYTALHFAVRYKHIDAVNELLTRNDIDINVVDNDGNTPLHMAAYEDDLGIVQALLSKKDEKDLKIDEQNNDGKTPLQMTSSSTVVEALIDAGADKSVELSETIAKLVLVKDAQEKAKAKVDSKESESVKQEDEGDVLLLGQGLFEISKAA